MDEKLVDKGLHDLSFEKLLEEQSMTIKEKKQLKEEIKQFENKFHFDMGRKMKREDREPAIHIFESYKKVKSKLKLINILLEKQKKRIDCE